MPEIPFALRCSIPEDQLLNLKDSVNGYLNSTHVTNIPEFEYFLRIYPYGCDDERRGQTWIFLNLKFKNVKRVVADYTFTIESANYSSTLHYVFEKSTGWGICICKTNELFDHVKKFIVDGKLTVKVHGIFKYETENEDTIPAFVQEQKWSAGEFGDESWKRNDNKNFTIIVGDKEIKVHKLILDIRSDVFSAMLNSNMKEAIENKVTISDFSYNVVETALKLIYECNFTSSLSMEELMSLLQFFDKYQLTSLKAKIEPLLINLISASTVCRLTNCSISTNSIKLKEKCMEFLSTAFVSKTPLADFDDLDKDTIISIIKNSFYKVLDIEK